MLSIAIMATVILITPIQKLNKPRASTFKTSPLKSGFRIHLSDGAAISVSGGDLSTLAVCVSIDSVLSRAGVLPLYGERGRGLGRQRECLEGVPRGSA